MQQRFRELEKSSTSPTESGVSNEGSTRIAQSAGQASSSASVSTRRSLIFTGADMLACTKVGAVYGDIALLLVALSRLSLARVDSVAWFTLTALALAHVILGACVLPFYHGWKHSNWRHGFLMTAMVVPMGMAGML